jgi:hypothetical protein
MQLICNKHGISEHRLYIKKWKCKKCEYVYSRRYLENVKLRAIKYGGGECQKCGYDTCWRALHFHHINPEEKEFAIFESRAGRKRVRNWEKLKLEINKCILLCSNCHTELHANDEKKTYAEFNLNLSRLEIELYNKSIISGKRSADEVFNQILTIKKIINV